MFSMPDQFKADRAQIAASGRAVPQSSVERTVQSAYWERVGEVVALGKARGHREPVVLSSSEPLISSAGSVRRLSLGRSTKLGSSDVDGQRKCPAKWPAKMSLVLLVMITDGFYSERDPASWVGLTRIWPCRYDFAVSPMDAQFTCPLLTLLIQPKQHRILRFGVAYSVVSLAKAFDLSRSRVHGVVSGKTHRNVTQDDALPPLAD